MKLKKNPFDSIREPVKEYVPTFYCRDYTDCHRPRLNCQKQCEECLQIHIDTKRKNKRQ